MSGTRVFGWRRASLLATVVVLCLSVFGVQADAGAAGRGSAPRTIVSLTFDDGHDDQYSAASTMRALGLTGTFYINSGFVGASGFLSRANLTKMARWGNEIGGHTVLHADLTQVDPAEAEREICNDRYNLQSWGFAPVSFAYPFSAQNDQVRQLVTACGYLTARGLGDVQSADDGADPCSGCALAESLPPADPTLLRAPSQVNSGTTLAELQAQVTQASATGGWQILTFHRICADIGSATCPASQSITPTTFNNFLLWLKLYSLKRNNNLSVQTVDQVVRGYLGSAYPGYTNATRAPDVPAAPVGVNALSNSSLESINSGTGFPVCYQPAGWGTNTVSWSSTSEAHTGSNAESLQISNYVDGDAKLTPSMDLGGCSPTVLPGHSYTVSVSYKSTAASQFALYYRDASGFWYYWTASPYLDPAADWTTASFATPPAPAGASGASFGLALLGNGTLVTDDYSFVDPDSATPGMTPLAAPAPAARLLRTVKKHSTLRPYLPGPGKVAPGTRVLAPVPDGDGIITVSTGG